MKYRVDGLGLFTGGYCESLEKARELKSNTKKNRTGTIIVELEETEYIALIEGYKSQLNKCMTTIDSLQQENQKLQNQIKTLQETSIRPEVVQEVKNKALNKVNAVVEEKEKITAELTAQVNALAKREEGLREALGRWQKKATGEDLRPPKDIKQEGFHCKTNKSHVFGSKGTIKVYFLEKYLPFPYETSFNELEKYALVGLPEEVKLKRIYLDRGKWVARYESTSPLK
jgi:hypothetical protein